jgi:hypothetical protein
LFWQSRLMKLRLSLRTRHVTSPNVYYYVAERGGTNTNALVIVISRFWRLGNTLNHLSHGR